MDNSSNDDGMVSTITNLAYDRDEQKERAKSWIKKNRDSLIVVGVVGVVVGVFVLSLKSNLKRLGRQKEELDSIVKSLNEWYIAEQSLVQENEKIITELSDLANRQLERQNTMV